MNSSPPVSRARVSEHALVGSLWAGVAISLVFLLLRLWIRVKVFRRLQLDDPFVIFAWVLSLINAAIWTSVRKELYFDLALASGQLTEIPSDYLLRLKRLLRGNLAAYLLAYASLWSIKLSFIVFFRRFGEKLRNQRIAWYATLAFVVASYLVCLGTVDYHCLTRSGMDIIEVCNAPHTTSFEFVTLRLTTSLDILTDAAIIMLSTNVLWRIRLSIWTKLALGGIFSLTVFVIVIAIIRIVVSPTSGKIDLTWLVTWQGIELSVAVIVVSLASFRILYTAAQNTNRQATPQKYSGSSSGTKSSSKSSCTRSEWTELSDRSNTDIRHA